MYRHIFKEEVVYVGKGSYGRATRRAGRKYSMNNIDVQIVKRFDEENDALKFEEQLIQYYKSLGQCKYNDRIYHKGNCALKTKEQKIKKYLRKYLRTAL